VLRRRNLLKQAVSRELARAHGWQSSRHNVSSAEHLTGRVMDVDALKRAVRSLGQRSDQLGRVAERLSAETHNLWYEDLQDDPKAAVSAIFDFLGAAPPPDDFSYTAGYEKVHSDDLRDVVANFHELEATPVLARYL
jgi:LPS sulfotransferase NodH